MRILLVFVCLHLFTFSPAQMLTATQQSALNNYIELINVSVENTDQVMKSLKAYDEEVQYAEKKQQTHVRQYICKSNPEEYYYTKATTATTGISATDVKLLNGKANAFWQAFMQLDAHCKELEVYIRLEDYKQDQFSKFHTFIQQIQKDFTQISTAKDALEAQVQQVYHKLQPQNTANAYHRAEKEMRALISREQELLQPWTYNFNDQIPAYFPLNALQESIAATDQAFAQLKKAETGITYPASSMMASFGEAVASIQSVKKSAVDNYNFEAKQSDKHSNQVYADLINYVNHDLIVNYNAFVSYSQQNGQRLLHCTYHLPVFELKETAQKQVHQVKPFPDLTSVPIKVKAQPAPITPAAFQALNLYIDFINESVRAIHALQQQLRFYAIHEASYTNKKKLEYKHENFKIPLSYYQTAINSTSYPQEYRKPIHAQAETLLNILKEMDELGIELYLYTKETAFTQDNFAKAAQIRDRYVSLFDIFDERKEQLYADIKKIFDAYPVTDKTASWHKSGKALLETVDLDKEILFDAKDYLKGKTHTLPQTSQLEASIRAVIANEYTNMKGIERIGRNNGLCPYNPYEDIPKDSKTFAEEASKINRATSVTSRPYESLMYRYNQLIDTYNKFTQLARIPILKNIRQPDLFLIHQPYTSSTVTVSDPAQIRQKPVAPAGTDNKPEPATPGEAKTVTIHDTVKIVQVQQTETVKRDTVFIEKMRVDTVYVSRENADGEFLSMNGYASNNMVFLLDVSSSMAAPQKLPLLKNSMKLLVQLMRPQDEVSIVIYSGNAKTVLPPTSAREKEKINKTIDKLTSDGATDGNAGIQLAYKVASKNYIRGGNNRIILASDGEFTISQEVQQLIAANANTDIFLSVFDFGNHAQYAQQLRMLAQTGKGNYEHITRENADIALIRQAKAKKTTK